MVQSSKGLLVRGVFVQEQEPCDIVLDENGKIANIKPSSKKIPDIGSYNAKIGPLLFDIQVNGAFGIDLQSPQVKAENVGELAHRLLRFGVAKWIPTLITAPWESLLYRCGLFGDLLESSELIPHIPGIHLEGPYISDLDGPRGAHDKRYVRKPNLRDFEQLYRAAKERIIYVTIAPELPNALAFIKEVTNWGVVVGLGHHAASERIISKAVEAGARLSTHLGNGLASQLHRHNNPLWPQLANDQLYASFIADLEHLPSAVLKTFVRAKGYTRTILCSDVVPVAGLKPGKYQLLGVPVELRRSGRICLSGTDLLAGSSLMLLQGVVNATYYTDLTLPQAFACAGVIPAQLFGVPWSSEIAVINAPANFVVFEIEIIRNRPCVKLHATFVNGKLFLPPSPAKK